MDQRCAKDCCAACSCSNACYYLDINIRIIEKRLLLASEADFVICLYNPSSHKRHDYLKKACELMLQHKSPDTVCGIVKNIGREGESSQIMTLDELKDTQVDMFTTVFIGNSQTRNIKGKMVTPRGYRDV